MDRGAANVPYLLAQYLFRHAEGRKSSARLPGYLEFPLIDMGELVKLNICIEIGDEFDEGDQVVLIPVQAPQQPPPPPLAAGKTMPQRLGRLEEEVQGLRHDVRTLRGLVERSMTDQGRLSTWM
ncbi:hypothetical protein Tco_0298274, partial [Tanacetum coccineum]